MNGFIIVLSLLSCIEIALFVALILFYRKVKASEQLVTNLYNNQQRFLQMLTANSSFEEEFAIAFAEHIENLRRLDTETVRRITHLEKLLTQADSVIRSPEILRETILQGLRQGIPKETLAHKTGASIQEIEIIATRYDSNRLH